MSIDTDLIALLAYPFHSHTALSVRNSFCWPYFSVAQGLNSPMKAAVHRWIILNFWLHLIIALTLPRVSVKLNVQS